MIHLEKLITNKASDETVILSLRRHWFVLIKSVLALLFLAMVPLALAILFWRLSPDAFSGTLAKVLLTMGLSIFYLGINLFLFNAYIDYYLDTWTVTNHRVVNIEQNNLFNRTVSELPLYRVQDVTSEVKGFFPTLLHYGDVFVQTAAEKERFIFKDVPNAPQVAQQIQALVIKDKEAHHLES